MLKNDQNLNLGRWNRTEKQKFIEGLKLYGKNWKKVEEHVGTRTGAQIRSHAQKFFNRIQKEQYILQNQSDLDISKMINSNSRRFEKTLDFQQYQIISKMINSNLKEFENRKTIKTNTQQIFKQQTQKQTFNSIQQPIQIIQQQYQTQKPNNNILLKPKFFISEYTSFYTRFEQYRDVKANINYFIKVQNQQRILILKRNIQPEEKIRMIEKIEKTINIFKLYLKYIDSSYKLQNNNPEGYNQNELTQVQEKDYSDAQMIYQNLLLSLQLEAANGFEAGQINLEELAAYNKPKAMRKLSLQNQKLLFGERNKNQQNTTNVNNHEKNDQQFQTIDQQMFNAAGAQQGSKNQGINVEQNNLKMQQKARIQENSDFQQEEQKNEPRKFLKLDSEDK